MAQKPDLWMPLYFGAYLTDTMHLTTEQHGAYLLLLMACWKRGGSLPDDDDQLAAIAKLPPQKWRKTRAIIEPFWQIGGKCWRQKRLGLELDAARERSTIATENGKKGGRPKKTDDNPQHNQNETGTKPRAKPNHNPDESSGPLPRPLQTSRPLPGPGPLPEGESQPLFAAPKNGAPAPAKTAETWNAYCSAYTERYTVKPLRNAKVNGQLAKLVDQLGSEEAPKVAEFYLSHNGGLYVSSGHCVDLLLRDCAKLRTEMLTGRKITRLESRNAEAGDALRAQVDRVGLILEGSKS